MSRIFFPLRTGVELFEDSTSPAAVTRAKQAAVLYDELIFESGLYKVSVTSESSSGWWHPPETLTDEHLKYSRRVQAVGTPFSIALGVEGSDHAMEFVNAPLTVSYVSEYHTEILDELMPLGLDWVNQVNHANQLPSSTPAGRLVRTLDRHAKRDRTLMPETQENNPFLRNWIIGSFNRDAVIASSLEASFNLTSLFGQMLKRENLRTDRAGSTALDIAAPNLSSVPWEGILEFRAHPGSNEARTILREFEEKAAREDPEDALAYLNRVSQEVTHALFSAYEELRPRWPERIAAEVSKTLVGLDPNLGTLVAGTLTGAEWFRDFLHDRRSWIAAMMVLKQWGAGPRP